MGEGEGSRWSTRDRDRNRPYAHPRPTSPSRLRKSKYTHAGTSLFSPFLFSFSSQREGLASPFPADTRRPGEAHASVREGFARDFGRGREEGGAGGCDELLERLALHRVNEAFAEAKEVLGDEEAKEEGGGGVEGH